MTKEEKKSEQASPLTPTSQLPSPEHIFIENIKITQAKIIFGSCIMECFQFNNKAINHKCSIEQLPSLFTRTMCRVSMFCVRGRMIRRKNTYPDLLFGFCYTFFSLFIQVFWYYIFFGPRIIVVVPCVSTKKL